MKWIEGKRLKKCLRCQIYTEKNEGCNHMTCVNCNYQWCWLCEGQYNYGHYDSDKCAGYQFTHADNLEEIPQVNGDLLIDYPPFPDHFGLHKIFGSYYLDIPNNARVNIMNYSFFLRYVFMLLKIKLMILN